MTIWELDFYSRPLIDENQKKVWEVLICESPLNTKVDPDSLFKYAQFCSSKTVNSLWLGEAIDSAIAKSGQTPKKIRFFRRQMNNMITKACEDLGIPAAPSRHTYVLNQWLEERVQDFYPQQPGYDENAAKSASVQYVDSTAVPLPAAMQGHRGDKWALVSLEATAFEEMSEWDISFSEAFPLSIAEITPDTRIPGLIIFSPRSIPLAAWISGLELAFMEFIEAPLSQIVLETDFSDRWILANINDPQTLAEAKGFQEAKSAANGVHFLAIQSNSESESFAGFWLLKG